MKAFATSIVLLPIAAVHAFNFTSTIPSQCDDFTVSWTGGQPPFRLLIIPPGRSVINISIPSTVFNDNTGQFTTQLALPQFQKVFFGISDATGITAGGLSPLVEVDQSASGRQCNTTAASTDFTFSLDATAFVQCQPYPFTLYSGAVQPITIFALIPSGPSITLHPPEGDSFLWNSNLTAGTSVAFSMTDSQGRDGGTPGIVVVTSSVPNNTSCLSQNTPSPSPTTTGISRTTTTPEVPPTHSALNTQIIIGASVGGVALIGLVAVFTYLWLRRSRRKGRNPRWMSMRKSRAPVDFTRPSSHYAVIPFEVATAYPQRQKLQLGQSSSTNAIYSPVPTQSAFSENESVTTYGGSGYTQRVIVHSDITETTDELIELPPRYSTSRAPIPGMEPSETSSSSYTELSSRRGKARS